MKILPKLSAIVSVVVAFSTLNIPFMETTSARRPQAAYSADAPIITPDTLVSGNIHSYFVESPKLYWRSNASGSCPPGLMATQNTVKPAIVNSPDTPPYDEFVRRISIYGGEQRAVWQNITDLCEERYLKSNIVADIDFVYWVSNNGVVRQSTNANPGDAPELVTNQVGGAIALAIDAENLYVLGTTDFNGPNNFTVKLWSIKKSDKTVAPLLTRPGVSGPLTSFAISAGKFLYWLEGRNLLRFHLATRSLLVIGDDVSNYHAEGESFTCNSLFVCAFTDYVFTASGPTISRYNNINDVNNGVIYTAPVGHSVNRITSDRNKLFINVREAMPCDPFPCFILVTDHLYRRGRGLGGTTDLLYSTSPGGGPGFQQIDTVGDFVVWKGSDILRLPKDAAALPKTNMRITGLQVTQGIQKPDNSVILIKDRRTFVRVFVQSDGPANVEGVTARLYMLDGSNNIIGTVLPANQPNTYLTVRTNPNRINLNDSFLFELPWSWVSGESIRLRATLNPFRARVETNYTDNIITPDTFTLNPSAALKVNFVAWGYTVAGVNHYPRSNKDIFQTFSWMERAYPLASKLVLNRAASNQPGFHPVLKYQYDSSLGARVMQTHKDCASLLVLNPDGSVLMDDRNACATNYTNRQMVKMRAEEVGLSKNRIFYGMISDAANFPRGGAGGGGAVASGPAGTNTRGWDFDGSYADWYAAHEIGHTLGRAHPSAGSDDPATTARENCAHSRSDNNYPYGDTSTSRAPIGTGDAEGFDAGNATFDIPRNIYPSNTWNDVMSYCSNQWISDYTYKGMYDRMNTSPPQLARSTQTAIEASVNGDFLLVGGTIMSGTSVASIGHVSRLSTVMEIPALVSGGYFLRLYDAADAQIVSYPFMPESTDDGNTDLLSFSQVITAAPGMRALKLVRGIDSATLVTKPISANAPVVGDVSFVAAPNPITGSITLAWAAIDTDHDSLTFEVLYSANGGTTWQPVASGISGNRTQIDTSILGGSTDARFRVVANDGANRGAADSGTVSVANKAPQPMIIYPVTGHSVQYGQLVNFNGTALDWQDGGVSGTDLVWSSKVGPLGTGELVSSDSLPVGTNVITLTATNSNGTSARSSITVTVHDNLELAGPTLTVDRIQASWHFAKDEVVRGEQVIEVSNSGSGELEWSASTSVPWLSIHPITGTAPARITLTADSTVIANGAVRTGTIIITAPPAGDQPTQTLTIRVGVAKGYSTYTSSERPSSKSLVHLPVLMRP